MPDGPKLREITDQQEAFCQHYTTHWDATRSAKESGYSEKSAGTLGYQLLQNPLIQKRIDELREPAFARLGITQERILNELALIAFGGDMKKYARWNASGVEFYDSDDLSPEDSACIQEISETTNQHGGSLKIKRYDKVKALELLGKFKKLFADRVELSGRDGKPIETKSEAVTPEQAAEGLRKLGWAPIKKEGE